MARAGRDSTGARSSNPVIAHGALRCSNATCTTSGKRTELDLTREDARDWGSGNPSKPSRICNVCTALAWLEMLCRRAMIDGEDPLRAFDESKDLRELWVGLWAKRINDRLGKYPT